MFSCLVLMANKLHLRFRCQFLGLDNDGHKVYLDPEPLLKARKLITVSDKGYQVTYQYPDQDGSFPDYQDFL